MESTSEGCIFFDETLLIPLALVHTVRVISLYDHNNKYLQFSFRLLTVADKQENYRKYRLIVDCIMTTLQYKLSCAIYGHNGDVRSVTATKDGKIVSGSRDMTAKLWVPNEYVKNN